MNILNHVALLCKSVDRSAARLAALGLPIGPREIWDGEGTAEIYIGDTKGARGLLLLMESVKDGAYRRAMEKRGPGLHHIAVDVPEINAFIPTASKFGWFLHPRSLESYAKHKTIYLARPGFPALIEVEERAGYDERAMKSSLISSLKIRSEESRSSQLIQALGIPELSLTGGSAKISISGHELDIGELTL